MDEWIYELTKGKDVLIWFHDFDVLRCLAAILALILRHPSR